MTTTAAFLHRESPLPPLLLPHLTSWHTYRELGPMEISMADRRRVFEMLAWKADDEKSTLARAHATTLMIRVSLFFSSFFWCLPSFVTYFQMFMDTYMFCSGKSVRMMLLMYLRLLASPATCVRVNAFNLLFNTAVHVQFLRRTLPGNKCWSLFPILPLNVC